MMLMLLLLLEQKEAQPEELQGAEGGQCDSKMPLLYAMLEQDDGDSYSSATTNNSKSEE